jgi:hypothetical protein
MNFKRKRHKTARAGCLMCKPHKRNGWCSRHKNMRSGDFKRYCGGADQLRCERIKVSDRWDKIGG